ncbi:MAG: V-type ATP synthase subunit C [Methanospirillum sp.]
MVETFVIPGAFQYVCTRLQVRKTRLYPPEYYARLLQMSLPQMVRAIGEDERYRREIYNRYPTSTDLSQLERALTENLAREYREVLKMTPGILHELTAFYLHRWDIVNVMAILRGKKHGLPRARIAEGLVPAGDLDRDRLEALIDAPDLDRVVEELKDWPLYPELRTCTCKEMPPGEFARIEDRLYRQYYLDLLAVARRGIRGGEAFARYLRFEIDILNMRNLFRLRAGSRIADVEGSMVPGGNIPVEEFARIAGIENREAFVDEFEKTNIIPVATRAMQALRNDPAIGPEQVADLLWSRWKEHRTTVHVVEVAVTKVRLEEMDRLATRHPFTVLPIVSYLEHKRIEIGNLRAAVRGRQFGIPDERIRRYLVV